MYGAGWYVVAYADELPIGVPAPRRFFGTDVVLWRSAAGAAVAIEARCPHMGTNLAIDVQLRDDCVRCPMHGWTFDGSGSCTSVPNSGSKRVPSVRATSWPLMERDGLVWVWWPVGEPERWDLPRVPEHDDNRWTSFSVLGNHWTVATTPQMVQENACDIEHLRELHGFPEPSVVELHTDGPVLRSSFTHLRSYPEAGVEQRIAVSTSIDIFGLGLSKQTSTAFGDIRSTSLCTTTPIDEARVDLRMASAVQRLGDDEITAAVHKTVLDTTRATIEEDIPLWETRDYGVVAPFTRDRGIVLFRRWAAQFYETAGDVVSEPNGIDAGAAVAGIGWR